MSPPPDDFGDPFDDASSAEHRGGRVPEFVRKVAVAGLGALFMTEEGIRNLAGQLKLPKEVLGHLLQQAEKTKDEVGRVASEEIRRFLQSDKLREEFVKLFSGMTVEIKAQVRLVPSRDDEGAQPGTGKASRVTVSDIKARPATRAARGRKE